MFFLGIERAHLMNANRLVQTASNIDRTVCNAIQLVRRCPLTINKKTSMALRTERRSQWNRSQCLPPQHHSESSTNKHSIIRDRNTPVQCEKGESIHYNHRVPHFSLQLYILKYLVQAWIKIHVPPREFAEVPQHLRTSPVWQQITFAVRSLLHVEPTSGR
jgi:hypothetical protein